MFKMSDWDIPSHQIRRTGTGFVGPGVEGRTAEVETRNADMDVASQGRQDALLDLGGVTAGLGDGARGRTLSEGVRTSEADFRFDRMDAGGTRQDGDVMADGQDDFDSPKRLAEANKDLTQGKRDFTRMKQKYFANLQNVPMLTDEELAGLRNQLDGNYSRLLRFLDKARQAADDRASLQKIDDNFAPYAREHDRILQALIREQEERVSRQNVRAADTTRTSPRNLYPDLREVERVSQNESQQNMPGDTPFRTVNQTMSSGESRTSTPTPDPNLAGGQGLPGRG